MARREHFGERQFLVRSYRYIIIVTKSRDPLLGLAKFIYYIPSITIIHRNGGR